MHATSSTNRKGGASGRALLSAVLALVLGGCASGLAARDDARVVVRDGRLYVVAEPATLRSICASLGESAAAAPAGSAGPLAPGDPARAAPIRCGARAGRVTVCAGGDVACVAHEGRHAREGEFRR